MTTPLSPLAEAIIEDKWVLCDPEQAVAYAIAEYVEYTNDGRPYLFGDEPVGPMQFIMTIHEIIDHFIERNYWGKENPW